MASAFDDQGILRATDSGSAPPDRLRQALLSVVQVAHSSAESCAAGQGVLVSDEFITPHEPGSKDRN